MPQNLSVVHNSTLAPGVTSFTVTANDSSIIALTVNGEIIGVTQGTGNPATITIPSQSQGSNMIVTIFKQNYYRYQATVPVVAISVAEDIKPIGKFITNLYETRPNPVKNDITQISFSLAEPTKTSLKVYNASGKLVKIIVDEFKSAGFYSVSWNCKDDMGIKIAEGVYFYTLETPNQKFTRKLILTR